MGQSDTLPKFVLSFVQRRGQWCHPDGDWPEREEVTQDIGRQIRRYGAGPALVLGNLTKGEFLATTDVGRCVAHSVRLAGTIAWPRAMAPMWLAIRSSRAQKEFFTASLVTRIP